MLITLSSEARCALAGLSNLGSARLSKLFLSFVVTLQDDGLSQDSVGLTLGLTLLSGGVGTLPVERVLLSFVLILGLSGRLTFF